MEVFELPAIIFALGLVSWLNIIATRVIGIKHARMQHAQTMKIIKELNKSS